MADRRRSRIDAGLGLPPGAAGPAITVIEIAAAAASLLWLVAAGGWLVLSGGSDGAAALRGVVVLVALVLPVAMIWVAATALRSARIMREESRRLQAAVDAMRQTILAERQSRGAVAAPAPVPATAAGPAVTPPPAAPGRPAPAAVIRPLEEQPSLALGPGPDEDLPPLSTPDLIRALNFPENDRDEAGFVALRRALKDRRARQMIQAAQDVLTLLSQDGIYMDDLQPDLARPEVWRRFARGERGRAVAALGGIRDRSCLALTMNRMREDTIFRDSGHHFLRLFDRMLTAFEPDASDEEIIALSDTRTARAFMLLGRVTGAFD